MLDDWRPLLTIVAVWTNFGLLPAVILCFWFSPMVAFVPAIVPSVFIVREQLRQNRANIPAPEYTAPRKEALEEYIQLVKKDKPTGHP